MDTHRILNEIIPLLRQMFHDTPTIALAGAHAKGVADQDSDIDLFLFGHEPIPYAQRRQIIESFADSPAQCYISESFDRPYGGNIDFVYRGVPVEVVVRYKSVMEEQVARCCRGDFEIIPQTWTSNGYYSFIYLSEVNFLRPLLDEDGWLSALKSQAASYPPALKANILQTFLRRAGTWIHNFHYRSAIARADALFVAPLVVHTLMDMVQVIFALNEIYFTGDKKLEAALRKMPYCPSLLLDNLEFLLDFQKNPQHMKRQAEILEQIYAELTDKIQ